MDAPAKMFGAPLACESGVSLVDFDELQNERMLLCERFQWLTRWLALHEKQLEECCSVNQALEENNQQLKRLLLEHPGAGAQLGSLPEGESVGFRQDTVSSSAQRLGPVTFEDGDPATTLLPATGPFTPLAQQFFHNSEGTITTMIVRNLPPKAGKEFLLQKWPPNSQETPYNLLHMPFDFRRRQEFKYVFVNFLTQEGAERFRVLWHGARLSKRSDFPLPLDVQPSVMQGIAASLEHIKQQRLDCLGRQFWPIIFAPDGVTRISFDVALKMRHGS